eukprot:Gb_37003 [translate_table: standard]
MSNKSGDARCKSNGIICNNYPDCSLYERNRNPYNKRWKRERPSRVEHEISLFEKYRKPIYGHHSFGKAIEHQVH